MINRLALKTLLNFQETIRRPLHCESVLVPEFVACNVVKRAKLMPNKGAHFLRFNKASV